MHPLPSPLHWLSALLLLIGGPLAGASFSLGVQPDPVPQYQQGALVITSTEAPATIPALPQVKGLTWEGGARQESSIQIVNGRRTANFTTTYAFTAESAGKLTLPDFEVQLQGNAYPTKGFQIRVQPYDGAGIEPLIDVELTYNGEPEPPQALVIGEVLQLRMDVYVDKRLQLLENQRHPWRFLEVRNYFPTITFDDVLWRDYTALRSPAKQFFFQQPSELQRNGRTWRQFTYICAFYPIESGVLNGSIRHWIPYIANPRGDPILEFFGNREVIAKRHPLRIDVPEIRVRPLPAPPARSAFLGLVGEWDISVKLDTSTITLGKDATLSLRVSGSGNIEGLSAPNLHLPGFNVYDPEVTRTIGESEHTGTITWVVVPRSADSVLPPLEFYTYNVATSGYKLHRFTPTLDILPGESPALTTPSIIDSGEPERPSATPERRVADIQYIQTQPTAWLSMPLWREALAPLLVLVLAGPLLTGLGFWLARRRERLRGGDARRRQQALRQRKALFRRLQQADEAELPALVRQELVPHLAAVLGLPPGSTVRDLRRQLGDEELAAVLEQAEAGGFVPGQERISIDRSHLLQAARRISCVLLLGLLLSTHGASFDEATAAYNRGDYAAATELYQALLREDAANAALCYNLGNCAYAMGELGSAIAWYERARRLAPRNTDTVVNLNFVRRQLNLRPVGEADSPLALLATWRDTLRPDEWLLVLAGLWCLAWALIGLSRWRGWPPSQVATIPIILALLAAAALLQQQRSTYADGQAVIVIDDTPLFRLPGAEAETSSLQLGEGEYVRIAERRGEWVRVRIDDNEGWLREAAIRACW